MNFSSPYAVVVNDDFTQLSLLSGLVRKAGLEPRAFRSAEAALTALSSGADTPALIVTDLYMPGIDGWQFCRLLRSPEYAAFNRVPILVVSATFSGDQSSSIAADLGAEAFLPSPVDGERFCEQVRAILNGESEERYRSLYAESRDAIMVLSPDKGFLSGNPTAIRMFACRDEQEFTTQMPASLSPMLQPDGKPSADTSQEMMRIALEQGSHFFEWTHCRMDGTEFPATVLLSRIGSGHQRLLQATVRDITERKQAEAALQRATRASELLRQCLLEINACLDFNSAMTCLTQKVIDLGSLDGGAFYLIEGQDAVLRQQMGLEPEFVTQMARRPLSRGCMKAALENPKETVNVIARFPEEGQLGKPYGLRHAYCIALMAGEQPFGFLDVVSRRVEPPSAADIEFIRILALETGSLLLRFRVEDRLQRVSAEQRIILDTTPVAVFFLKDRKVQWANPAFSRILGYTDEESMGLDTASFYVSREEYERVGSAGYEQLAKGEVYCAEVEMKRKDGSLFWASIAGRCVDMRNPAEGSIWTLHDTTERQHILEALQASELRQHSILTAMSEGVVVLAADGTITDCNLNAEKILGMSRSEIMGLTLGDPRWQAMRPDGSAFPSEDHPARVSLRTGRACHDALMVLHLPDGTKKWININAEPMIRKGETRPYAVVTSFADITERKRAEAALQESERFVRATVDALSAHVAVLDEKGTILAVNRAWRGFAQANAKKMAGLVEGANYLAVCDSAKGQNSEGAAEVAASISAVLQGTREEFVKEYPCHSPTQLRWFVVRVTRFPDEGMPRLVVAHEDITERKLAEAEKKKLEFQNRQLQKSESLGRMAGAIAHHFNNQLQVVMMNLQMAIDELPKNVGPVENLAGAMLSARKAAKVSILMLTYLGQTTAKGEPMDLSEACQRHLPMLRAIMPQNVVLETDLTSPGPTINANTNQIQQILTNLLTNAWEAMGEARGVVRLTVKTVATADITAVNRYPIDCQPQGIACACLEMADSACGIAAEDIEKVFDPFFSTKFTGRGLGLSVVLGIVKAHDGCVTVESQQGKGSVFRVFLPLSVEAIPQKLLPVALNPKAAGGGTVLVVDDEPTLRQAVSLALKRSGFTVFAAADGVQALEVFQQHRDEIRCVLCDLTMPHMNGWDTLTALRKLAPDIPVILASGYSEAQAMEGDHPELPQAFLSKPYELPTLRDTIARVIGNPKELG